MVYFLFFYAVTVCVAQNILIWRNDNKSSFFIPEEPMPVNCDDGIKKSLTENEFNYTLSTSLPDDITQYDIIFITLGFSVDCG
jgi:hypothetical protein